MNVNVFVQMVQTPSNERNFQEISYLIIIVKEMEIVIGMVMTKINVVEIVVPNLYLILKLF